MKEDWCGFTTVECVLRVREWPPGSINITSHWVVNSGTVALKSPLIAPTECGGHCAVTSVCILCINSAGYRHFTSFYIPICWATRVIKFQIKVMFSDVDTSFCAICNRYRSSLEFHNIWCHFIGKLQVSFLIGTKPDLSKKWCRTSYHLSCSDQLSKQSLFRKRK